MELTLTDLQRSGSMDAQGRTGDPTGPGARNCPRPDRAARRTGRTLFFQQCAFDGGGASGLSLSPPSPGPGRDCRGWPYSVCIMPLTGTLAAGPSHRRCERAFTAMRQLCPYRADGSGLLLDPRHREPDRCTGLNGSGWAGIRTPDYSDGEADPNAGQPLTAQPRLPFTVPAEMRGQRAQEAPMKRFPVHLAERLGQLRDEGRPCPRAANG